jgi:molybdopterin synthase catalytic subunit
VAEVVEVVKGAETAEQREARVRISEEDFDVAAMQRELTEGSESTGAVVSFVGLVRDGGENSGVQALEVEHYPGMTEASIEAILDQAEQRWCLDRTRVIHRVGHLSANEQIVYVGVSSQHRGEAFYACEFVMDFLKTRAPLWKKEHYADTEHWVEARDRDGAAAERWFSTPDDDV